MRFTCGHCKTEKDAEEFAPSQRQNGKWCRACFRAEYRKQRPALPDRACSNCGGVITSPKPQQKFCSRECKDKKAAKLERALFERRSSKRSCEWCGNSLEGRRTNTRWCSERCANWGRGTRSGVTRRSMLKRKYGLTVEEFDGMLAAQDGRCAICATDTPGVKGWCVDHCHDSGRVRGVLCTSCNTAIGQMKDNPVRLRAAADYLERNQADG